MYVCVHIYIYICMCVYINVCMYKLIGENKKGVSQVVLHYEWFEISPSDF